MVARDITIDGDPDEVWEALNDPELLAEWLGDDGQAVVEEAEPSERLRSWATEGDQPGARGGGRRGGLAGGAAVRGGAGRPPRGGDRGAGRAVRARGRVSPEPDVFAALGDPTRR